MMRKIFLTGTLCVVSSALWAQTTLLSTAEKLQAAADLYFAYQPEKALDAYIKLSKDTQDREAFLNAAFIAMEQNNPKLAVDIATAAYRAHPQDNEIIQTAAEAYLADGQYASAEMLLSQLSEPPGRAELVYINLARAQMGLNETKLAKYNLRQATHGKVHTALSNYLLGLLYEKEQDYKKAVKHFKIASEYDHQFIEAKLHYAAALEKTRDYNESYRQYRMIYTLEKKNDTVRNALARLLPKLTRSEKELTAGKTRADQPRTDQSGAYESCSHESRSHESRSHESRAHESRAHESCAY